MTEQENTIVLVENAIRKIGVDPAICKGEKVGQYSLVQGSANVWIDVLFVARENSCYFQVMSPIMILHNVTNKVGLFEELLTINDTLYNVAFTLFNQTIEPVPEILVLLNERFCELVPLLLPSIIM